jgi:hypothetical protein
MSLQHVYLGSLIYPAADPVNVKHLLDLHISCIEADRKKRKKKEKKEKNKKDSPKG